MGGGLLQLLAYGAQDYAIDNTSKFYEISIWRPTRKYNSFNIEIIIEKEEPKEIKEFINLIKNLYKLKN